MEDLDLSILYDAYYSKLQQTSTDFVRYLYSQINWDARIVGIKGARGMGKTTMLLQRIKFTFGEDFNKAMYASLDNIWFNSNSLLDLVKFLDMRGIHYLFLDEVHKYKGWAQMLKNIYDNYPAMNIVYTGSSLLEIDNSKVDMSRRQTLYTLEAMSFREFLEYEGIVKLATVSLQDILERHIILAMDITEKTDVMAYFEQYLRHGCYPFYKESGNDFLVRLRETVTTVIESDVPAVEDIQFETLDKMKKMLMIVAAQVPYTPNIKELCDQIATTRNQGLKLLYLLDKAKLLRLITERAKRYDDLVKPEKVLLDNANLMYALAPNPEIGTVRETFFASQIALSGQVTSPSKGDYLVDGAHLFEVGGKKKRFNQIKDIPDSYLAVDNTKIGLGNKIPLWMFGMTY